MLMSHFIVTVILLSYIVTINFKCHIPVTLTLNSYSDIVQLLIHCTFPVRPALGMGCCLFLEHILDDTPRWSHLLTELYSSTCGTAAHCATVTTSITLDAIPLANLAPVHNQRNDGTHEPTDETEQS